MTSLLLGSAWGGVMQQAQRGEMQQRASFMPKSELLAWINGLLQTDYAKIEQCANGAAYCQVLDSLFTDEFPLRRVSFKAKAEHESLKNYKLIQEFFMRKGIAKTVDIEKMMKGRPMDNLEFLQWLRGFYDEHQQGPVTYDAASRRKNCGLVVPASSSRLAAGGQRASNVSPRFGSLTSPAYRTKSPMPQNAGFVGANGGVRGSATRSTRSFVTPDVAEGGTYGPSRAFSSLSPRQTPRPADPQVDQLRADIEALQHTVAELEKERDFYYGKLRSVEVFCQTTEESAQAPESVVGMCKEILTIMYAESSEDEAIRGDEGIRSESEERD
jgi:RP/EB family microtubule-associated protein